MDRINPSDFIALKAAVKAEMQRRKYQNSLEAYGGTAYDYTHTPASGEPRYQEHYTKNIVPLQAANSTKVPSGDMPRAMSKSDMDDMAALVAILQARTNLYNTSATDCNGNCAGACYTACSTTCSGTCTGGCSTTCTGSCSGSCSGGCQGYCGYDCSGSCIQYCRDDCWSDCSGGCIGDCTGTLAISVDLN